MARHDRNTLGHIYQPTRPRQAYGRRPGSCWLAEELPGPVPMLRARDVPETVAKHQAVPMPGGHGVRWVVQCPRCGTRVASLYDVAAAGTADQRPACRHCLRVRHASQHTGRRPEAARERVITLRRAARRTRDPQTRRRRRARVRAIEALRLERRWRHDRRQTLAFTIARVPALIRSQARLDKRWARIVMAALHAPAEVRAQLAEHPDTPAWAAQVLRTPLATDHWPTQAQRSVDLEPNVMSRGMLDALRAKYAMLTPPRQHRKAA